MLALSGVIAFVTWIGNAYAFPFVDCRVCGGSGKRRSRRRAYGSCWRCKGTPKRLRPVRRVIRLVRKGIRL